MISAEKCIIISDEERHYSNQKEHRIMQFIRSSYSSVQQCSVHCAYSVSTTGYEKCVEIYTISVWYRCESCWALAHIRFISLSLSCSLTHSVIIHPLRRSLYRNVYAYASQWHVCVRVQYRRCCFGFLFISWFNFMFRCFLLIAPAIGACLKWFMAIFVLLGC